MEQADASQQISKARPVKPILPLFDFSGRARPSLLFEDRPVSLGELTVEAGLMRDDYYYVGANEATLSLSIRCPATMSSVTPVSSVISTGIGVEGSSKDPNTSLILVIAPSAR